jgi:hypothetical protein
MAAARYGDIERKALALTKDFFVESLLQDFVAHKPDPWLRLIMRTALEIICKNKIFEEWTLKIDVFYDGRALTTAIRDDAPKSGKTAHDYACGTYFPLHSTHLGVHNVDTGIDEQYEIRGMQLPDTIFIVNGTRTDGRTERIPMVFEGEAHQKDHAKKNNGMFLYQKMFQDAAFCQDIHIHPEMSAIFIALALRTCEDDQTFPQWTRAALESCVLLMTRLLMYTLKILPQNRNFIDSNLRRIAPPDNVNNRTYDLYCWVNAKYKEQSELLQFDANTCFDEFSSQEILNDDENDADKVKADAMDAEGTKDHNCEFMNILKYNHLLSRQDGDDDWPLLHPNSEHTFYAKKIQFTQANVPITILAVERATAHTDGGVARTTGQKNIDTIDVRLALLAARVVNIDAKIAAAAAVPAPVAAAAVATAAAKLADRLERKAGIGLEVARLTRNRLILVTNLANVVVRSRGMWYPRNVQNLVANNTNNRSIQSLVPLTQFMVPVRRLTNFNFNPMEQKQMFVDATKVPTNIGDFDGHICVTLPWLWINIGFLYLLNRKVQYDWTSPRNLEKNMTEFRTNNPTGKWRGGALHEVEVQMFPAGSKTLFARLCRHNVKDIETVKINDEFEKFLYETCGWKDCNMAQSPAMFFRLLGVSNVKTGCLISSSMVKIPNPRFESIKKSFPLNAQVEIEYAVEALAATVYHTAP